MYHLTEGSDRQQALLNCHRILKPGGYLVVMYLSPFVLYLSEGLSLLTDMEKRPFGVKTSVMYQNRVVPQFRCWPSDAAAEAGQQFAKLDVIEIFDNAQSGWVQEQHNAFFEIAAPQFAILYQSL
jgi:ubiquinone/menaquinone biosynthesis C-methylase UbiE